MLFRSGSVFGGQQPVSGATVQLWSVGTSGYGSVASPLGSAVSTNSNGGFTLGSYTCPANSYAYITAAGGNPQTSSSSITNPAIALMAALGPCSSLSASTIININEVTTVAAVWALAPFGKVANGTALVNSGSTPSDTFGTTSTNVQGIANAMGIAQILANYSTGSTPGTNTTGNVYNVEYWQVNALANILALCVNSAGVSSSSCSSVVAATTGSGNAPADTLQMALYLAQNPTAGLSLLGDIPAAAPYQPYDSTVNDWTIGYSIPTGSADSRWIAIDQFGNAWVTTSSSSVYELSPTGVVISTPSSYTLNGASSSTSIGTSYEVAIDTANNAWFSDETKPAIFEVLGSMSAGAANGGAGTAVSTSSVSTGDVEGIVVDGSNNVWAAISGSHLVGLLNGSSTALVTGAPVTSSPFGMAVDLSNQKKFGNTGLSGGGSFIYALDSGGCSGLVSVDGGTSNGTGGSIAMDFTTATTIGSTTYTAGAATPLSYIVDSSCNNTTNVPVNSSYSSPRVFMSTPYGVAFDNNNNMWVVNQNYTSSGDTSSGHYSLSKLAAQNYSGYSSFTGTAAESGFTFTSIPGTTGGLNTPYYLAMDGAGAAWVANSAGAGVSAFTNAGTAISPSTGFSGGTCSSCTVTGRKYSAARGIAVDGSGNVWVANTGAAYVTVVVGAATPTVTPLSLGIKNGTLASEP